jgi:hypothetical protein
LPQGNSGKNPIVQASCRSLGYEAIRLLISDFPMPLLRSGSGCLLPGLPTSRPGDAIGAAAFGLFDKIPAVAADDSR